MSTDELSRDFKHFKVKLKSAKASSDETLRRARSLDTLADSLEKTTSEKRGFFHSLGDSINHLITDWKHTAMEPHWGLNISAGVTVAAVALPLNLALAVAAGLPPTVGLIAGAVGGGMAALFGGSRFQVTGPAAALNAMVFGIVAQFGAVGAAAAAVLVGLVQITLSMLSAGTLIRYVPEAVLLGFTSGVGIKLLDSQLPKLFGVEWSLYQMLGDLAHPLWLHDVTWPAVVCGLFVIFLILACRAIPRFPAALVAIAVTTQLAIFLDWPIHRIGEIPPLRLALTLPQFSSEAWAQIALMAVPLGLLAAVESVLSAQVIDRMSGDRHHSNLEVLGQGVSNLGVGLLGGMPVSGVIVRSSVNVQSGARNRLSSFFHAAILLGSALFMGGILSQVPTASLAGLLCIIGFRLVEFKELVHLVKANKAQALGFLLAAGGTVTNHIVGGLALGLVLAWLGSRETKSVEKKNGPRKITQVEVEEKETTSSDHGVIYSVLDRGERWLQHLKEQASVPNTSYVHPNASVIGRVVLGRNVHIAAEASVRADEGTPFYIGDDTNIQDGVVIHALKQKWITIRNERWAVYIGSGVSLAHHALVHGPCYVGDSTFVGFKAVVHDSIVGKGCYIGIGAIVVGVEIPDERYVPHGAIIDSREKVQTLAKVTSVHRHFNDDVVEVNKGLAEAYRELAYEKST